MCAFLASSSVTPCPAMRENLTIGMFIADVHISFSIETVMNLKHKTETKLELSDKKKLLIFIQSNSY